MEHTYIDTKFEECDTCRAKPGSPTLCNGCLKNRQIVDTLVKYSNELRSKVRTETLMECRGLVGEDEITVMSDKDYDITVFLNLEKKRLRTAIDNLIKEETV